MLFTKSQLTYPLLASFCLILIDQLAKWLALSKPQFSIYLVEPWLGWELFKNPGVAFGLPLPNWLLIIGTPLLLLFLVLHASKRFHHPKTSSVEITGYILIVTGAVSNYFDRVVYGVTIDYLRLLYSVINIADITIVLGLLCILKTNHTHIDKT